MNDLLLLIVALACIVLAMAQLAGLARWQLGAIALTLAVCLVAAGDAASHTSLAALGQWLAVPQRRLDLAALLLIEALLYSQQALAAAQGRSNHLTRLLAAIPPPSLLIVLFLALVWAMLEIDGIDYEALTAAVAVLFPAALIAGAVLLHRLLPDILMRTGLRLVLHGAQLGAGLWLARPVQHASQFKTYAMWDRLGVVVLIVLVLMAVGWLWQRGFIRLKRSPQR